MYRLFAILCSIVCIYAAEAQAQDDPYANVNYKEILSLRKLHELEHQSLDIDQIRDTLFKALKKEKRKVALKPLKHSLIDASLKFMTALFVIHYFAAEGFGGFVDIIAALAYGVGFSHLGKHTMLYFDPDRDYLHKYEEHFVNNIGHYPKVLHLKILDAFEKSRKLKLEQERFEEFFETALHLSAEINTEKDNDLRELNRTVNTAREFTNKYISQYKLDDANKNAAVAINTNVTQFIRNIYNNSEGIICFRLNGSRVSGKYQYIQDLAKHLTDPFKNFAFELIVNSSTYTSLLGDQNSPGELLRTIAKLRKKNQYGIIMVDSAEAFDPGLQSAVEILFGQGKSFYKPEYLQHKYQDVPVSLKGILLILMETDSQNDRGLRIPLIQFPEIISQEHKDKIVDDIFGSVLEESDISLHIREKIKQSEEFKKSYSAEKSTDEYHQELQRIIESIYATEKLDVTNMAFSSPRNLESNSGKNSLFGDEEDESIKPIADELVNQPRQFFYGGEQNNNTRGRRNQNIRESSVRANDERSLYAARTKHSTREKRGRSYRHTGSIGRDEPLLQQSVASNLSRAKPDGASHKVPYPHEIPPLNTRVIPVIDKTESKYTNSKKLAINKG